MKKATRITALITSLMLLLSSASCSADKKDREPVSGSGIEAPMEYYSDTTENVKKSETVYVNLDNNGKTKSITVSDWLHADRGMVQITDATTLKKFDVTKGQAASLESNGTITWHMGTSDIYYEGKSDKKLPIDISIEYFLDGSKIKPEDLAGKSGRVKIEITFKNNISEEVEVGGKKMKMYAPLAAVGGMVLPYENFSEIDMKNALSIGGGSYEIAVLAGIPGVRESLGLDKVRIAGLEDFSFSDKFTIEATAENFALGDMYFAVLPLSSMSLDIQLPKTIEDLKNVLNEIGDLNNILEKIDPNQVLMNFITDGASLKELMSVLNKTVTLYKDNKELFDAVSMYLTPENIEILSNFANNLSGEQMQQLINVMSNVPMLKTLVDSMLQLSSGLDDVVPILNGISEALNDPVVAAQMENLPETLKTIEELMEYLNKNKEVLNILTQLLSSDDIDKLTNTLGSITSAVGDNIGDADMGQMTDDAKVILAKAEKWLGIKYEIYTAAPDYMETSCMFIMKTDPITFEQYNKIQYRPIKNIGTMPVFFYSEYTCVFIYINCFLYTNYNDSFFCIY